MSSLDDFCEIWSDNKNYFCFTWIYKIEYLLHSDEPPLLSYKHQLYSYNVNIPNVINLIELVRHINMWFHTWVQTLHDIHTYCMDHWIKCWRWGEGWNKTFNVTVRTNLIHLTNSFNFEHSHWEIQTYFLCLNSCNYWTFPKFPVQTSKVSRVGGSFEKSINI